MSTACSQRKASISGHWVSVEYFGDRSYHTLDIYDSVLYVNRKCKICGSVEMKLRKIESDQFVAMVASRDVPNFFEFSGKYLLAQRNDSLVFVSAEGGLDSITENDFNQLLFDAQIHNYNPLFIRSEIASLSSDPYAPFDIIVDPIPGVGEEIIDINDRHVADMFVGKPKSEQWQIAEDSVMIETDDVFINLKDVPLWVSRQQDIVAPSEKNKVVIRLSLDKKVSNDFKNRLIQTIRTQAPSAQILEARLDTKNGETFFVNTKMK
jgi:hypothetical protein